jgi:predicted neutral ceramidase superfamily lipid hydrolase
MGIASATLCVVHCILTPFLLIIIAKYEWWENLTYLFLAVSLYAVYEAIKAKPPKYILSLICGSYVLLIAFLLLEETWYLAEPLSYIASLGLVIGHVLNVRHCKNCINE